MISLLAEFLKYRTNLWLCAALSTLQIFLAFSLCLIVTPHVDLATAKHLLHNFEYWFLIANVLVNTFSGIVRDAENITAWEYALAVTASYVASLLGNLLYLIFDSYMAKGRRVKMIKLGILFFAFLNDIRVIVWLQFQWAPLDPVLIYNQLFISTQFTLMLFRIKFIVSVFRDNIILLKQKVAIKTHDNSEEQRYNSDYSLGTSLHTTVASQTLAGQTIHLCPTHPFAALFFNHSSKCRKCHQSLSLQPFLKQFCASFSSILAAESWAYGWGWTQIVLTVLSVFLACPFFDRTVAKDAICAFDFWFLLSYVVASVCSGLFTDLQDETYMSKHSNSSIAASFFAFLILVALALLADAWHGDKKIKSCVVLFSLAKNVYQIVANFDMESIPIDLVLVSTTSRIVYLGSLIQISIYFAKFVFLQSVQTRPAARLQNIAFDSFGQPRIK